jgi:acylphosphatase
MADARRHAHFRGNVQGVGFRYTTRRIAQGYDVSGFVRNLPDGRVEVVAEGSAEEVEAFLSQVQRAMGGYIREARMAEEPPTGEFDGFGVAF